jgi:hypothetical protein
MEGLRRATGGKARGRTKQWITVDAADRWVCCRIEEGAGPTRVPRPRVDGWRTERCDDGTAKEEHQRPERQGGQHRRWNGTRMKMDEVVVHSP